MGGGFAVAGFVEFAIEVEVEVRLGVKEPGATTAGATQSKAMAARLFERRRQWVFEILLGFLLIAVDVNEEKEVRKAIVNKGESVIRWDGILGLTGVTAAGSVMTWHGDDLCPGGHRGPAACPLSAMSACLPPANPTLSNGAATVSLDAPSCVQVPLYVQLVPLGALDAAGCRWTSPPRRLDLGAIFPQEQMYA
ncbi:hypothetical protein G7046_g2855 [Stylonectria norvegica]|nr:hypothetical protein G7046_g2855 [Stylonectria norvegica]